MNAPQISDDKLIWHVIIHAAFVLSAMGIDCVDRT